MALRTETDGADNNPPPKNKVSIRGGFSDRNGIKSEPTTIQYKSFNERTRTGMNNLMNNILTGVYGDVITSDKTQNFIRCIHGIVYLKEIKYDKIYRLDECLEMISETIRADDYASVLSLIEYVIVRVSHDIRKPDPIYLFNAFFEKEYVGYRFVGEQIAPIINEMEIQSIEDTLQDSEEAIKDHIEKAVAYISDLQNPDYANSIKESISAVEAACNRIVGKNTTFGDALKNLERNGVIIHSSLKEAFHKLYGYTNSGKGIRHAGNLDGSDATFAEAEFMLVACSAFINYLKTVQVK